MLRNIRQARPPRPAQGPGSLASGDIGYGGKESKPRSKRIYYLLFLIPVAVTVWSFLHNHGDVMSSVTPAGVPPIMRFTAPTAARRESIETQRPTAGSLFVRSPSPSPASEALSSPPPPPPPPPPRRRPAKSPPPAEPPPPAPIPSPAKPPAPEGCKTCASASHLFFNQAAVDLFRKIDDRPPGKRAIMVSFSSLGMQEFMVNWARQVEKKNLGPLVIGALDEGAFKVCTEQNIPAVSFGHLSMKATTAYFRQDEGTFLSMATLKSELLRGLLESGWDCMMSDVDVSWLDSPWRWIGTNGVKPIPEAARMAKADVLVSSDVVEIEADSVHGRWLLDREYNTGIIFFRATNASIGLVKLWRERLEIEGAIKGLYINDQAVFNRMTHGHADGRIDLVELEPDEIPDVDERAIRGVYKIQSPIMKPHKLWVSMGTFPLTRFCNGHVFFVNRLPERFGFQTAAVHATYQFADEKTYSFGKRHRLRQAQLWHMDADDYFTKGNFLAVHGDSLMVGVESVFSDKELPVWRGKEYRENNGIDLHMRMEGMQRQRLRDAFALAQALDRILVLPHMTCFCDRYWWLLHACRMPGAESMPLPIECPLDHIFDMGRWYDVGLQFREARFLENSRVPYEVAHDRARLKLNWEGAKHKDASSAPEYDDGSQRAPSLPIEGGTSLEAAAAAISAHALGKSRVLEIEARDLSALCGFEDLKRSQTFDNAIAVAFTNHVAICGEEDNILPTANWDPVKLPLNCTQGYRPPEGLRGTVCKRSHCNCKGGR